MEGSMYGLGLTEIKQWLDDISLWFFLDLLGMFVSHLLDKSHSIFIK